MNKMENNDDIIEITYKPQEKNIKLFDYTFVDNNKDNCNIIYKDKEYDLDDYFDFDKNYNNKDLITIKLKGINHITNMNYMFFECDSLISIKNSPKLNTSNIITMSNIFSGCTSLIHYQVYLIGIQLM